VWSNTRSFVISCSSLGLLHFHLDLLITTVSNSFTFDFFNNFNGPFTDSDNDIVDDD